MTFTNDVIVSDHAPADERTRGALAGRVVPEVARSTRCSPNCSANSNCRAMRSSLPVSRGRLRVAHTAMRHMLAHLGEPLSVRDLAQVCGVGVTSFTSSFREATGVDASPVPAQGEDRTVVRVAADDRAAASVRSPMSWASGDRATSAAPSSPNGDSRRPRTVANLTFASSALLNNARANDRCQTVD